MKLKKISAICAKSKTYCLLDKIDTAGQITQWLGDGSAAYPLDGLPLLDGDSLCKMFDISGERREKTRVIQDKMPERLNAEDIDTHELPVEPGEIGIADGEMELLPIMTREGAVFIQKKYLSPLEDEAATLGFCQRRTRDGQVYIAVKAGLLLRAIIYPVDVVNEKFMDKLEGMVRQCRRALEQPRRGEPEGGSFQLSWTEVQEDDQ